MFACVGDDAFGDRLIQNLRDNGAFAYALANEYPVEKALAFANVAASLSTEGFGAQGGMPTLDQVSKTLSNN